MRSLLNLWAALLVTCATGFILQPSKRAFSFSGRPTRLLSSSEDASDSLDETQQSQNNQRDRDLLRTRDRLVQRLEDISSVQESLVGARNLTTIGELERSINIIEKDVAVLATGLIPPPGLSREEYVKGIARFMALPFRIRWALCMSLEDMEDAEALEAACEWDQAPEIVSRLYTERSTFTQLGLKEALDQALATNFKRRSSETQSGKSVTITIDSAKAASLLTAGKSKRTTNILGEEESEEDMRQRRADALLARVTRKEGREATEQDLKTLLTCLNRETFTVSGTDKVSGGFILRGASRCKTGEELVQKIEDLLPEGFPGQVCYLEEFTLFDGGDHDPVLVLLNKDMSPSTNGWILATTSGIAVLTAFLFSYGVYSGNDAVSSVISNGQNDLDLTTINWFNAKIAEVLVPMVGIQLSHELGHFIIAQNNGIKTCLPTLLPCLSLPFLSPTTSIRESPKNYAQLFDFAFLGPFLGLAASLACFLSGLQMTNLATSDVLQYFPTLPVNVIKISTLGGSIVDFFAGGDGFITSQDPSAEIPLHPLAIAGFVGLVINALELIPLGATDGGRLSLSLFGRKGHAILSGFVWLLLILASFFVERTDAIIGAWLVFSITQNDGEIPCRDEATSLDALRAAFAFLLWFSAALIIIPM